MNPTKPWYASAAVWGALVTLASSVLALLKVELDPALLADIQQWVFALATLIGGAVSLWGRIRANRRIATPPQSLLVLLALLLVIGGAGCEVLLPPGGSYVAADRATFDAVAPEYRQYVAGDPALDHEQRARRDRTLELWRARVEQAEGRESSSDLNTK